MIGSGGIEQTDAAEWDRVMDSNVRSMFMLTRLAIPELEKRKGSIVNISSVGGMRPYPNLRNNFV